MKKILFMLLVSLLFIPLVMAEGSVSIESIDLVSKSDGVRERNKTAFEGLEMGFDLIFSNVGDSAKYKVILKNDSDKNYTIDEDTQFSESQYFSYSYEVGDTLEANSSIEMYVVVSYDVDVEVDGREGGIYVENNKAVIKLLTDEEKESETTETSMETPTTPQDKVVNPETKSSIIMFAVFIISLVTLIALVLLYEHNLKAGTMMIVMVLISVPLVVKAIEEIKVTTNVRVQVSKEYKVVYEYPIFTYFTQDEYDTRDTTKYYCESKPTYFVSFDTNPYYSCSYMERFEDSRLYAPGEEVTIVGKDYSYNACLGNVFDRTEGYLCDTNIQLVNEEYLYWIYSKTDAEHNGFISLDDDGVVMNFRKGNPDCYLHDSWSQSKIVYISKDVKFTMPAHDVFISASYGG